VSPFFPTLKISLRLSGVHTRNLFWQAAAGAGAVERLTESPYIQYPTGGVTRRVEELKRLVPTK
jgi:hypothetical protein